ncbi:hypothetical protein CVT26_013052 [Gymnopilus dilepis]|uniref:Uncharacterized protein n=1 Tax=Gymnopilus dilepis TaxID=231916 RepID=A0A409WXK5_9AGAR|nr:hypothetical protein CVT26_013052 [Gymnopilus dilepis]
MHFAQQSASYTDVPGDEESRWLQLLKWDFNWGGSTNPKDESSVSSSDIRFASDEVQRANLPGRVKCMVFSTCGSFMTAWMQPVDVSNPDILEMPLLFPNGYTSFRIAEFPLAETRLLRHWRLYVARTPAAAIPNAVIWKLLKKEWSGNVVLAKYGSTHMSEREWMDDVRPGSLDFGVALLDA